MQIKLSNLTTSVTPPPLLVGAPPSPRPAICRALAQTGKTFLPWCLRPTTSHQPHPIYHRITVTTARLLLLSVIGWLPGSITQYDEARNNSHHHPFLSTTDPIPKEKVPLLVIHQGTLLSLTSQLISLSQGLVELNHLQPHPNLAPFSMIRSDLLSRLSTRRR